MAQRTPVIFYVGVVALVVSAALFYKTLNQQRAPGRSSAAGASPYRSVEALIKDHKIAFEQAPESDIIQPIRSYYVCKAIEAGSESLCSGIEKLDKKVEKGVFLTRCRALVLEGLAIKEVFRGGTALDARVKWWRLTGRLSAEQIQDGTAEYQAWGDAVRKSDPSIICSKLEHTHAEMPNSENLSACLEEYAYTTGDPDRCPKSQGEECREKIRLIAALRENKRALAADSMYASLLSKDAPCKPLTEKVLAAYDEGLALHQANQEAKARQRDVETARLKKGAQDKEQLELALQKMERKKRAEMVAAQEELQARRQEAAAQKEAAAIEQGLDIKRKYNAARMKDEQNRKQKGLPMRRKKRGSK